MDGTQSAESGQNADLNELRKTIFIVHSAYGIYPVTYAVVDIQMRPQVKGIEHASQITSISNTYITLCRLPCRWSARK